MSIHLFSQPTTIITIDKNDVKMITVPVSCAAAVELEALVEDTMENKKRGITSKAGRKTILELGWCE